ncbi:MAG: S8 family serine peptidase [Oligoflexales bacterium]
MGSYLGKGGAKFMRLRTPLCFLVLTCIWACRSELTVEGEEDEFVIRYLGSPVYSSSHEVINLDGFKVDSSQILIWEELISGKPEPMFMANEDGAWSTAKPLDYELKVRNAFESTGRFAADSSDGLYIVQFQTPILDAYRRSILSEAVRIVNYLPNYAYVVRTSGQVAQKIKGLEYVRSVDELPPTLKHAPGFVRYSTPQRYDVVLTDTGSKGQLVEQLRKLDATVMNHHPGEAFLEAVLNSEQFEAVLQRPDVVWVEPSPQRIELDVDKARFMGGESRLESLVGGGFLGEGIRGHSLEGMNPDHSDFGASEFRQKPIGVVNTFYSEHGQNTFGIMFGDGTGNPLARGFLPRAQGYFTNSDAIYDSEADSEMSRFSLTKKVVDEYQVMFQSASWGYDLSTDYTARSLELDNVIYGLDIPITQSQSNSGDQFGRPQAWSKNVISVGAIYHYENLDMLDDKWDGGSSIGPAADGRIKPDLVSFYDSTLTTTQTGYTEDFGGTSGATPIVAGHVGLTLEMWTKGVLPTRLAFPKAEVFQNKPHFTTVKALLINTATQYEFFGEEHDLSRSKQGWGFPSLGRMYDLHNQMLVVNEEDKIRNLDVQTYRVEVANKTPELKATLVYSDPPGMVTAGITRVNDLDLKVIAPSGEVYWGNFGLTEGNYSKPGGQPNAVDTVENVFIKAPESGVWVVEVLGSEIVMDTVRGGTGDGIAIEVDYALVVSGIEPEKRDH